MRSFSSFATIFCMAALTVIAPVAAQTDSSRSVARVYITRVWSPSNQGIVTYLVNADGTWTFEKRFIAAGAAPLSSRPCACVKIGSFFYVLDQYTDPSQKFSIYKYDRFGVYRGTLVDQYTSSLNQDQNGRRDNVQLMAASRDGRFLWIPTWQAAGALMLRVSVADGAVTEFSMPEVGEGADVCVGPDETVYVAARNRSKVFAFRPDDFSRSIRSYDSRLATGIYFDDETDRLFIGTHWNTSGAFASYKADGSDKWSFVDARVYRPGSMIRIGDKIYFGGWAAGDRNGEITSFNLKDHTFSTVLTGLGCINHVAVENLLYPPAEHTSLTVKDGVCYFAADNAASAEGSAASSTVWKSVDGGISWTEFATFPAANPSLFVCGNDLSILFEPRRTAAEKQYFEVGELAADGLFTRSFAVTNNTGVTLTPANGAVIPAHWGFAAGRSGIGFSSPYARTAAALTFVTDKTFSVYPDAVFTSVYTNAAPAGANIRNPFADTLPAVFASGPELYQYFGSSVFYQNYHQELVPVVQRRTDIATRLAPEYVIKTEHLNPNKPVEFSPKWGPYPLEYIPFPGGSKEFTYFYDASSGFYWAVSMPVTNSVMLTEYEPDKVRNVLALYASSDLRDWRLCRVLRTEGTPDTVAFARPNAVAVEDDLLVVYSTTGSDDSAQTTIGERRFVSLRVEDFRSLRPLEDPVDVGYVIPDFSRNVLKIFHRDAATGFWTGEVFVPSGKYGGKDFAFPSAVVVHRDSVYVTSETVGVFKFDVRGRFLKVYPLPTGTKCDTLCVSRDGRYLLVTDSSWINSSNGHNSIRKLDLGTGEWITLVSKEKDSTFFCPRGVCLKSDGSFFVASRDAGFVRHYAADGQTYKTIISGLTGALSVALDKEETHLFVGTRMGEVRKYALEDGSYVVLTAALADKESGAYSIALREGKLWVSDMGAGLVYTLDPNQTDQVPVPVMSGLQQAARGAFIDYSGLQGTMILVR